MAIQVKRTTDEIRKNSNVVLEEGQPLYTIDSNELFISNGTTPVKDLKGTQIGLNIKNNTGAGSLAQVNKGVTDSAGILLTEKKEGDPTYYDSRANGSSATALNVRCNSNGDASVTGGYNAIANTKGDVAFNNSIAGLTKEEFDIMYPNGFSFTDDGKTITVYYASDIDKTASEPVNEQDKGGFLKRVVNGAFACNNGKALGSRSFSAGYHKQEGYGSLAEFSATFGNGCVTKFQPDKDWDARCSLVGGLSSIIFNPYSIGYGKGLKATNREVNGQKVPSATFGQFNSFYHPEDVTMFEVGNGTDDDNRSNSFQVTFDGRAQLNRKDNHSSLKDTDLLTKKEIDEKDDIIISTAKSYTDTEINALNYSSTGSTTKTLTLLSQTNGEVSATYSDIAFPVTSVAGKTGAVTLTKSNVGLSNVDNTSDAIKKANFTGSITSGNTGFVKGGDVYTELDKKANKATTLSGYGITDACTESEIDTKDTTTLNSAKSYTDTKVNTKTLYLIKFYLYTGSDSYENGSTLCIITSDSDAKTSDGEVELKSPIISAYIYTDANKLECKSIISFKTDVNGVYTGQTYRIKGIQIAGKTSMDTVGYNATYKVQSSTGGYAAPNISLLN